MKETLSNTSLHPPTLNNISFEFLYIHSSAYSAPIRSLRPRRKTAVKVHVPQVRYRVSYKTKSIKPFCRSLHFRNIVFRRSIRNAVQAARDLFLLMRNVCTRARSR